MTLTDTEITVGSFGGIFYDIGFESLRCVLSACWYGQYKVQLLLVCLIGAYSLTVHRYSEEGYGYCDCCIKNCFADTLIPSIMNSLSTSAYLSILTLEQLQTLSHGVLNLPHSIQLQKLKIISAIEGSGNQEFQTAVFEAAQKKYDEKFYKKCK